MGDFHEYSVPELVRLLGSCFKEYRLRQMQKEAEEWSVVVMKIQKFETGIASNIWLGTFLLSLKAIEPIGAIDIVAGIAGISLSVQEKERTIYLL